MGIVVVISLLFLCILLVRTIFDTVYRPSKPEKSPSDQSQAEQEELLNKEREAGDAALAAEMGKPKYRIRIHLGKISVFSSAFDPELLRFSFGIFIINDSKSRARLGLAESYERGYFVDENENSYPVSAITKTLIEEVK